MRITYIPVETLANHRVPPILQLDRAAVLPLVCEVLPPGTDRKPVMQQPIVLFLCPGNMHANDDVEGD
jgi:hypothetical protein